MENDTQQPDTGATPEGLLQHIASLLNTIFERTEKLEQRQTESERAIDLLAEMNSKAHECATAHQGSINGLAQVVGVLKMKQFETDQVLKNHREALLQIPGVELLHRPPEGTPPTPAGVN